MPCYFFKDKHYLRVRRNETGGGTVDAGYPKPLSNWNWGKFGKDGIDAALYSGPVDYFFSGDHYIRVSRGDTGPGKVDSGYPKPISEWGWGDFGKNGIDAALWSDTRCYFFSGRNYIRVTRGDRGAGSVDDGYPKPISEWGWGNFGKDGIDAALNSGSKCYFFAGDKYIRVTRGDVGAGRVDNGYPKPISEWGWGDFGKNGIDTALFSGQDFTDPVALAHLSSNSNYFIENSGANLTGVEVTIDITEDLVLIGNGPPQAGASSVNGFTFQLNCYSPKPEVDAWQQYVIGIASSDIGITDCYAQVNNWKNLNTFLINTAANLGISFDGNTLPAGHKLRIRLNNDASANVTGATFIVYDADGSEIGKATIDLRDHGITKSQLSPIVAYQFNIVGPGNSESAFFLRGAGTILYQSHGKVTASASKPGDAKANLITAETANTNYAQLSGTAGDYFMQHFGVSLGLAPESFHVGEPHFRPPLRVPPKEQRSRKK